MNAIQTLKIEREEKAPIPSAQLIVFIFLPVVAMLFAAFASAYLIRRTGEDWHHLNLPPLVWLNTFILLMSSLTFEWARRRSVKGWMGLTAALGGLFLFGQVIIWHDLVLRNVFLSSGPFASFFYLISGAHGLHLLAGILFLLFTIFRWSRSGSRERVAGAATYWHFMALLWVGLLAIISIF